MLRLLLSCRRSLLLMLVMAGVLAAHSAASQGLASSGWTRIAVDPVVAANLSLQLSDASVASATGADFDVAAGSSLGIVSIGSDIEGFGAGGLRHVGELSLSVAGESVDLAGFQLVAGPEKFELELRDAAGTRWFSVRSIHARIQADVLEIRSADLLIAPELAALIGRSALAWTYVGRIEADWNIAAPAPLSAGMAGPGGGPCDPNFDDPPDLALIGLQSVTQGAREPGGRVAVSASATLRNEGAGSVEWYRAIAPASPVGPHPFLALHFYRLADGVLEQLGRSDLKHAFFAVNSNCSCLPGQILFSGCEDVYGVNTNLDRFNLAPREELMIGTRTWESLGSHFDGEPVDDSRDHDEPDHDDFDHRLVVQEPDLQTPGARYFIEGWYIAPGDTNLLNSLAHREVTPTLEDDTWAFQTVGSGFQGSILDVVVDADNPGPGQASELVDPGDGRLQLAVDTGDLGEGLHRYEFVLMNFDLASGVRSFTVPQSSGIPPSNPTYNDGDANPANDWTISVEPNAVVWTAPTDQFLDWGTLISFGFEAEAAPVATTAILESAAPEPTTFGIATLGPAPDDRDLDGTPDVTDNCPDYATADLSDTNADGRGDACECGDQNLSGAINVEDILAINAAVFNPALVTPLCDANGDTLCDIGDILAVSAKLFGAQTYCERFAAP
jgi:hypothetical protein